MTKYRVRLEATFETDEEDDELMAEDFFDTLFENDTVEIIDWRETSA
jgi:hypothetical protein